MTEWPRASRRYASAWGASSRWRHGHVALVLGAWGCGVFQNDPARVAELFREALAGRFRGAFTHAVFAVLDTSPEQRFLRPFQRAFAP